MLLKSKKAQGLGGLLRVIVIGLLFWSFYPFLKVVMDSIIGVNSGAIVGLLYLVMFLPVYFFFRFAFNLGED